MELVKSNKNIRKELEIVNKNLFGLSSIYYALYDYLNNKQKFLLRQRVIKSIENNFSYEQINNLYNQIKELYFVRSLDCEIKEILQKLIEDFKKGPN